ncbi:hypothetical protein ARMSODRAFT_961780 [Armillaria solidipes]|uniref:Uncharacterized protein n=1 Tax=Armillaria solidipes TaxID=1076256 RepID=A0A2H3BC53_9AGAR|nr:hypothetical protein ARMSODRAFT_961780 [Armillaria solidipes]
MAQGLRSFLPHPVASAIRSYSLYVSSHLNAYMIDVSSVRSSLHPRRRRQKSKFAPNAHL